MAGSPYRKSMRPTNTAIYKQFTTAIFVSLFISFFKHTNGLKPVEKSGITICSQVAYPGHTSELRDERQAKANVVVAIASCVVVAICHPAVNDGIIPTTTAQNTHNTHDC